MNCCRMMKRMLHELFDSYAGVSLSAQIRGTLVEANDIARRWNNDYIGSEHVFLALIRKEACEGVSALRSLLGVRWSELGDVIRCSMHKGPDMRIMGRLPHTPRLIHCVRSACNKAEEAGRPAETSDLLIALLEDQDSIPAEVLGEYGITAADVAEEMDRVEPRRGENRQRRAR